jgi:alpha-tubulin suppressor-like RCC1 family protein
MGNRQPKSESEELIGKIPIRCLYMQGLNDFNQCGKDGYPFSKEKHLITAVSGMHHSLGILATGDFVSWGSNKYGQLGAEVDSYIASYIFEPLTICNVALPREISSVRILCISAGVWHSACVTETGQVYAWGLGDEGQLGINPNSILFSTNYETNERYVSKPTLVETLIEENISNISCGSNYSIVRTSDLKVFSFGNGVEGVLGNGNTSATHVPQEIMSFAGIKLKKIACGWNHCLALGVNGTVYSWGNLMKDIIEGSEPVLYPSVITELEEFKITDVSCGDYHCCALSLKDPNAVFVWGSNGHGQLGDSSLGENFITFRPIQMKIYNVSQIACGGLFTIAKLKDSSVIGWGINRQKQLGEKFQRIVQDPEVVLGRNKILKKISAGYSNILLFTSEPLQKFLLVDGKSHFKNMSTSSNKDTKERSDYKEDSN